MKSTLEPQVAALDLLSRVAEEFTARLDRGEPPDIEDFAARYPEAAEAIRPMLEALQAVRMLSAGSVSTGDLEGITHPVAGVLGDYRIIREVGRGGMGVVYEAEQISLGRRVALKVLPFAAVLDAKQLQRFKNEAQAAAALQHTNIVPVYSVGCERGVHYYAMQYIDGQTLAEVIFELKRAQQPSGVLREGEAPAELSDTDANADSDAARFPDSPRATTGSSAALDAIAPNRSTRTPDFFRSVANLGVQAAEALEHAHEFGIVHRDIKPSNLLLDQRGNLWITDFGLARLESNPDLTMTGDILGTLRYMSPEQAAGKNLLLDHRTDIYSLGVTLYELLTLRPAIDGRDRQELLRKIADEDPRQPRRLNAAIPADLETIVLKATAKEPQRRYASAKELAGDLERFLDDKPIRAKRPTLMERTARWSRRHKPLMWSGAALLIMAVFALSISTALIWQEQKRTQAALAQAQDAQKAEQGQRTLAEASAEEAQASEEEARREAANFEAISEFLQKMFDKGAPFPGNRDVTVREALDQTAKEVDSGVLEDQPEVEYAVRRTIGRAYGSLGLDEPAEPHLRAALKIAQKLHGSEHLDVAQSMHDLGRVLYDMGEYDAAKELHQKALELRRKLWGDEHPAVATSLNHLAMALNGLGERDAAEKLLREVLELQRKLCGDHPHHDVAESLNSLAQVLHAKGDYDSAEKLQREALALHRELFGDEHPCVALNLDLLARVLQAKGNYAAAEELYREALALHRKLMRDDHPHVATNMSSLAILLFLKRDYPAAEKLTREALELRRKLLGNDNPATLASIANMGLVLEAQGKAEEAEAYFRESLEGRRRVQGDEHPRTLKSFYNMAKALQARGKLAEAQSLLADATRAARSGPGDHPMTAKIERQYADVLRELRRLDEALDLAQTAVDRFRANPDWAPLDASHARRVLAAVLRAAGRQAEALAVIWESIQVTRQHPGTTPAALASALATFAREAIAVGDQASLERAEQAARESLEIRRTLLPDGHRLVWLRYNSMSMLGDVLVGLTADPSLALGARIDKLAEAEPLILDAYEWLSKNFEQIDPSLPRELRIKRVKQAGERVVWLYDAWDAAEPDAGYEAKAAEWRTKLEKLDG